MSAIMVGLAIATYSACNQLGGNSQRTDGRRASGWSAQGYVVSLQRPGNAGAAGRATDGYAPGFYQRSSRWQTPAQWNVPLIACLDPLATKHGTSTPRLDRQHRGAAGRALLAPAPLPGGWITGYGQASAAMMFRVANDPARDVAR